MMTPTTLGIAAGIVALAAGLSCVPGNLSLLATLTLALAVSTSRRWLHFHSWFVFVASITLLVLGLKIWTLTLQEKTNILNAYNSASPDVIAALENELNCCGFFNSTSPSYIVSNTCPNDAVAATRAGCVVALQPYADLFLNRSVYHRLLLILGYSPRYSDLSELELVPCCLVRC
jgi:hypothetical protein